MSTLLLAQIPLVILLLWLFTSHTSTTSFPTLTNTRILLLIAHPDDEAMFFSPSLLRLTHPSQGNQVLILCLSSGNSSGLGSTRKRELLSSAKILGITSPEHVVVLEDEEKLPDSMTVHWDAKLIAGILTKYFAPWVDEQGAAKRPSTEAPTASINAIITFDSQGVSGHPNHISLYHGARAFLKALMARHAGWECPVRLYTLTSVNVVRKYSSVVDAMTTVVASLFGVGGKKEKGRFPTPLLSVSGVGGVRKGQRAMTEAHQSQMRWFRWGWIGVSRYMVVNDLKREKVV